MKIAIAGKGGTGKTTVASLLIQVLSKKDKEVLAVDCDPDSNLGIALGFKDADKITPIIEMEDLIKERMGVSGDGTFFRLNPKLDDIPDRFSKKMGNVRLIVMGAIKKGGSGCACPENAFVKNLVEHLVLRRGEDVVMDMEAGVEHFGRGTAGGCDAVLVIVEPSRKSLESARRITALASDISIKKIYAIGNKVRSEKEKNYIEKNLKGIINVIETIPFSADILDSDMTGSLASVGNEVIEKIRKIEAFLYAHR